MELTLPEPDPVTTAGPLPPQSQGAILDWIEHHFAQLAPLLIGSLVFLVFAKPFFSRDMMVSQAGITDLGSWCVPFYNFQLREFHQGILPQWNPYLFGGMTFLGDFNSAVFYPPFWLVFILPLGLAFSLIFAMHVFGAGLFTAMWCRYRGISTISAIMAGIIYMFCGNFYIHVVPGHTGGVFTTAYVPLILLSIDGVIKTAKPRWAIIGALAVGMQSLASFAQMIYYTGLIAVLYVLLRLIVCRYPLKKRALIAALCAGMYVVGPAIGAIELVPGLIASKDSVRAGGTNEAFSGSCPMPVGNFVTAIAPNFWGGISDHPFHVYMWEVSLFTGCCAGILAVYGAIGGDWKRRHFIGTLLCVAIVLSLGSNIYELYHFMYLHLPGYSSVRGAARWNAFVALFVVMLAALGLDRVVQSERESRWLAVGAGVATLLVSVLAMQIRPPVAPTSDCTWGQIATRYVASLTSEELKNVESAPGVERALSDPKFIKETGNNASQQLLFAAISLALITIAVFMTRRSPRFGYLVALIAAVEMTVYAFTTMATCNVNELKNSYPNVWADALQRRRPDSRVFNSVNVFGNIGMQDGYEDIFGYDPMASKRYTQLAATLSGISPDKVFFPIAPGVSFQLVRDASGQFVAHVQSGGLQQTNALPFLQMLRCQFVCYPYSTPAGLLPPVEVADLLPHLLLLRNWQLIEDPEDRLPRIASTYFDPHRTVILESKPSIDIAAGQDGALGSARLIKETCNSLEIEADVDSPAILLVTDGYAPGWHARALETAPQPGYEVMPADQMLRAIPLAKGHHHFMLEYSTPGFVSGACVTIMALLGLTAAGVWSSRKARAGRAGIALSASTPPG